MSVKHILIAAIICLAGVSLVFAQSAPPPAAPAPTPQSAVHVTTRVVQVSVTVQDDRGRPVTGLTKDDFVLFDKGERQQIASFSEQTNVVTTTAAAPNVFTNRFEPGGPSQPPLTVIVLDTYNAGYWDSKFCPPSPPSGAYPICAIDPMLKAVRQFIGQMQPHDHVALYQLADTLYLLQDFTSDPNALLRGLEIARSHVTRFYPPAATDTLMMSNYTMNAMTVISKRLAFVSGRKNLIWLSNGFPYQRVITDEKIDKSAKILANAGLPLDAIDARGIIAPNGGGGGPVPHAAARGPAAGGGGPTPASGNYGVAGTRGGPVGNFNAIRNLSEESGGHAINNTNDLTTAIRRVVDASGDTYMLGYYPDHNKWNGEFREINVKVNRPGVEVHSRKGYYAVADTASVPEIAVEKLTDAMKSPLESTDLGFDVQADGVFVSGARQLKVKVTLDANQLRFQQQGEQWTDTLSETWAEFNSFGQQVGEISKTIDLNHNADDYKKLLFGGFTYSKTLVLAKDAAEVRLVLRDEGNGAIGSVIIPLWRLFAATTPLQPPTKQ
jgi:VWFA-related protein